MVNKSEAMALDWIELNYGHIKKDIKFNSHISPDFICPDGTRYEVKTLYGKKIIFYDVQLKCMQDNDIILVFDKERFIKKFLWKDRNDINDIKITVPNDIKQRITITVDEEISEWITKKSNKKHLGISTFLNQLLWETKNQ